VDGVNLSISQARAELQMPQTNGHRILRNSLRLNPHEIGAVSKVTPHDKHLRLQIVAHICAQILEENNSLSSTVFTDEAKLKICGCANRHNSVILGTGPRKENLQQEWDNPKVEV
jgi:hypothetical protein